MKELYHCGILSVLIMIQASFLMDCTALHLTIDHLESVCCYDFMK